jgi:hypothetical protein
MPLICPTAQAQGLRHDDTTGKSTLAAFFVPAQFVKRICGARRKKPARKTK